MKSIVHLNSGGLDSVALLHDLHSRGFTPHCLGFNYGQTHAAELLLARKHAESLGCPYTQIELCRQPSFFQRSALTDGNGSNVVPNRNAVLLHIACAIAAAEGADTVTIACNQDDWHEFPDCTPEFIAGINATLSAARLSVMVKAPYIHLTKRQIVKLARENSWPIEDTISCYAGTNCGKCDACKKRKEALKP